MDNNGRKGPGAVIGRNLLRLRQEQLFSQHALAQRAKVDPSTVRVIELGEIQHPRRETVMKLARALRVPFAELTTPETETEEEAEAPKAEAPSPDSHEERPPVNISGASGAGGGSAARVSVVRASIQARFDATVAELREEGFGEDVVAEFEALRERALRAVGAR